jgi:hypothetical protein
MDNKERSYKMKKMFIVALVAVLFWSASPARAAFTEDFDTFTLGTLVAQEGWEALSSMTVVTTVTSGEYVGGQALGTTASADKTTGHANPSGISFNLSPTTAEGVEYGFDFRESATVATNIRLYTRDGISSNYGPSVGLLSGSFAIRTNGEGAGTLSIYGNSIGSYEGTLWNKGDWVRMRLVLTGTDFRYATVYARNLTTGADIPTGLVYVDTGVNVKSKAAAWDRLLIRLGSSTDTTLDNAYIKDYVNTNPVATSPSPAVGAYPVASSSLTLSWTAAPSATAHKVYLGTNPAALTLQSEVTSPSYLIPVALQQGTKYYWRVDEVVSGTQYEGTLWNFTTEAGAVSVPHQMAYEGFNYTAYIALTQSPNDGWGGYGWATAWGGQYNPVYSYVLTGAGSLTPAFTYPFGTAGNMIRHNNSGAGDNVAVRKLSNPIDLKRDQDYYISYLVQGDDDTWNSTSVYLQETNIANPLCAAHMYYNGYTGFTSARFALRDNANNLTQFGSWSSGGVYLVVLKISAHVTGNDTVYMSAFGPTTLPSTEPTTWDASFVLQSNTEYPWLVLSGRADAYALYSFDELHVGTTWGTVTGFVNVCGDPGTIMDYDLNQDCQVNFKDFAAFAAEWTECTVPGGIGCEMILDTADLARLVWNFPAEDLIVFETSSSPIIYGDLSDWAGARWYNTKCRTGYNTTLAADITESWISMRWRPATPQVVYLAVKVTDTGHHLDDTPEAWYDCDNMEVRFSMNETSTDDTWRAAANHDYDVAQLYNAGATTTGSGWCSLGAMGGPGVDPFTYLPAQSTIDIAYAVGQSGNDYIYEFAIPTYSDFAGIKGGSSSKVTLADGEVIAFDLQMNNYVDGATGGALFNNQSYVPNVWKKFTVKLNSSVPAGTFGFFDSDIDQNMTVGFSDMSKLAEKWLSCTDPEVVSCDQPWLP